MPISEEESPLDSSSFEMQILSQDPNFSVNNSEIELTRGYRRRSKFLVLLVSVEIYKVPADKIQQPPPELQIYLEKFKMPTIF